MENSTFTLNGREYTIEEFLSEYLKTKKLRESWTSYRKFCLFASCLLLRNQSGTIMIDNKEYYKSNLLLEKLDIKYPSIEDN